MKKAKKNLPTKETPEQRKERLANGFKARPSVIPSGKVKARSRKVKHKKALLCYWERRDKMYIVEYQFRDTLEIVRKEFDDFIKALNYQGQILRKYKSKLNYCIYK